MSLVSAGERSEREDWAGAVALGKRSSKSRACSLGRDYEVAFLEHLGMPFEVGRDRLVADIDADFAQSHAGVERDQRSVAGVGGDSRRGDRYLMVEAERV